MYKNIRYPQKHTRKKKQQLSFGVYRIFQSDRATHQKTSPAPDTGLVQKRIKHMIFSVHDTRQQPTDVNLFSRVIICPPAHCSKIKGNARNITVRRFVLKFCACVPKMHCCDCWGRQNFKTTGPGLWCLLCIEVNNDAH